MPSKSRNSSSRRANNKMAMDNSLLVCGLVIVLLAVALYYIIKENKKVKEGFESVPMELNQLDEKPNPNDKEVYLVFFYVDWCPHCSNMKEDWKKLESEVDGQQVNNKKVNVKACNAEGTDLQKELTNEVGVNGFPTIKMIKKNEIVDHTGGRSVEELKEFIDKNTK